MILVRECYIQASHLGMTLPDLENIWQIIRKLGRRREHYMTDVSTEIYGWICKGPDFVTDEKLY